MKQAETFIDIVAACPHCGMHQLVEWADDTVDGLEEHVCEHCNQSFSYCHPNNKHGLAR